MREIKFRAWNLADKKWDKVSEVFGMNDYFRDLGNGVFRFNRGDVILMQYTGLKDKNGKEIYEGDILDITSTNSSGTVSPGKYKVVEGSGGFDIERESFGEPITCRLGEIPWGNNKIIGNIYENKELLK